MAATCYLRLQNEQHIDYLITAGTDSEAMSGSAFHDDQLPEFPRNLETFLIVPGTDVLLLNVSMPKTNRTQLEKALPFALEEQLIDDVDTLHFVAGKQADDGYVHVAVIKKNVMQAWLAVCEKLGLYPRVAIPDFLALPLLENQWHVYLDGEQALLRQASLQGMTIDINQLGEFLQLSLQEQTHNLPEKIRLDYDDANEHFDDEPYEQLSVPVDMASEHSFGMDLFQQGLQAPPAINLLINEFVVQKPKDKSRPLWRWLGIALIAWWVIWFAGSFAQYYSLNTRAKKVTQQITTLYKQVFPNAQSVTSPRIRIEQALKVNGGSNANPFLAMLTLVGQQISQQKNTVSINSINYRDNTLSLDVSADTFQHLADLSRALQQHNLSVQQQNATTQGKTVSARLLIKEVGNG